MQMKKILCLALVLMMGFSLVACGGSNGTTGGNAETTAPTQPAPALTTYSVQVEDALGNPYTENIVVKFMKGGEQVAMQPVNAEGVATKDLEPGDYDVELLFTDGKSYHFDNSNMKLTAAAPELKVELANLVGTVTEYLVVDEKEYNAPLVSTGCTYLELDTGSRNYFVFVPVRSGIYEFTIHYAEATIGYYGSPFYVFSENAGNVSGEQAITIEVKESMIGNADTGTAQLVLGIDSEMEGCVISITKVADYVPSPEEMPWTTYESTHTPSKYTLPEGVTIHEFDLTAATGTYELVFNETDGFYHLGTADGPIVLVRMNAKLAYGGNFGDLLAHVNVGAYFYDEDGNFLKKELYNDCLMQYLGKLNKGMGTYSYTGGMLDDTYNVYPLTKDLEYIICSYGERIGWWNTGDNDYLFADLIGLNPEIAWLFMCCYAQ